MYLIGTRNTSTQNLVTGDTIDFGAVYRKFCKKNACGVKVFELNDDSISLQHNGIYHLTATITFTAPVAGDVVFTLAQNEMPTIGATITETITTATTEFKTSTLDFYVLVDSGCLLGNQTTLIKNISIINTGVDATITNVVVNIDKVV